jgi:hypothetical protein
MVSQIGLDGSKEVHPATVLHMSKMASRWR